MHCVVICCAGYIRVAAGLLSRLRKNLEVDMRARLHIFPILILQPSHFEWRRVSTNNNAEQKYRWESKIMWHLCAVGGPNWSELVNLGQQRPSAAAATILPRKLFLSALLSVAISALFVASFAWRWWWRYAPPTEHCSIFSDRPFFPSSSCPVAKLMDGLCWSLV